MLPKINPTATLQTLNSKSVNEIEADPPAWNPELTYGVLKKPGNIPSSPEKAEHKVTDQKDFQLIILRFWDSKLISRKKLNSVISRRKESAELLSTSSWMIIHFKFKVV